MKYFIILILTMMMGLSFSSAFGHTSTSVGPYEIEVGWGTEPPVMGIRNDIVFEISEPGQTEGVKTPVKNAFKDLEATIKFGGISKVLDINSDVKPGHYFSPIIPTKSGSFTINVQGTLNGVDVDVDLSLEDVETTAVLDFPPKSSSANQDISTLKAALSSIQNQLSNLESGTDSSADANIGPAYDYAIFGLSLGAAGVILAIISMVKRK